MTIQELGTILQYKVPVKIVILNNNFLGMVRQWQDMFFAKRLCFNRTCKSRFCDDIKGLQNSCKKSNKERRSERFTYRKCSTAEGPYLLEIVIEKEGNVFPMVEPGSSVSEIRLTY